MISNKNIKVGMKFIVYYFIGRKCRCAIGSSCIGHIVIITKIDDADNIIYESVSINKLDFKFTSSTSVFALQEGKTSHAGIIYYELPTKDNEKNLSFYGSLKAIIEQVEQYLL